jgi:hypothetical protein
MNKKPLFPIDLPSAQRPLTANKITVEYTQQAYCMSDDENLQKIEISTEEYDDNMFFIMKTERWAFDSLDELILLIEDFKKRI